MSDMHDALNELAQRGTPRGFDAVLAAASDAAAGSAIERDAAGDDLDPIPFVTAEPIRRKRRPMGSAIAAAGVAALLVVGTFAVSAVVGSGGAGSPEAAVRRLADAISHEDLLAAADVLAPEEVRSLHATLDDAQRKAAELQLVQTAGAPLAGVDLSVDGLKLSTESLGNGFAKVTIDAGTISASTHKAQFSPIMQKVLHKTHDTTAESDLAQLAAGRHLPTFVVAVRHGGDWYVSASYTVLEYVREANQLPAADLGSGEQSVSTLGADTPDAAVQDAMRAIQGSDWSRLMTLVPPDEIPVYDYRAALTALADKNQNGAGSSKSRFTIDSMTTASQVDGDRAQVSLQASGTTPGGKWSIDGGCFTSGDSVVVFGCDGVGGRPGLLGVTSTGLDKSTQISAVNEGGRWFVSPVGTVLDVVDHWINQIDRRTLFTLLGIPNELPPDGPLTLGQTMTLDTSVGGGVRILSFDGHQGENLIGQAKPVTRSAIGARDSALNEGFSGVFAQVFAPDGTSIDQGDTLLGGQSLTLPSDGTYTFVFQVQPIFVTKATVTVWDAADAPASAKRPASLGTNSTCVTTAAGAQLCTSVGSSNGQLGPAFGSGSVSASATTSVPHG